MDEEKIFSEQVEQPPKPVLQLNELSARLSQVEKLHETVRHFTDQAGELVDKYLEEKTKSETENRSHDSRLHKRGTWMVSYAVTLVFGLCAFALWKEQYELVKLILTSGFAVAAGVGLTSAFRGREKSK